MPLLGYVHPRCEVELHVVAGDVAAVQHRQNDQRGYRGNGQQSAQRRFCGAVESALEVSRVWIVSYGDGQLSC
jgi:hypothetical protein